MSSATKTVKKWTWVITGAVSLLYWGMLWVAEWARWTVKKWLAAVAAKMTPAELRLLKWTWVFTGAVSLLYWGMLWVAEWAR